MTIKRKKFTKGVRIKPNTDALEAEGEITVDSADNKLKARLDSADRSVVTEDQAQTLTNKTIDADNNPISNIETDNLKAGVLVTDVSAATSDTELPSALAVKTALEGQNEASEITYDNSTSGLTATDVQAAVDEVEGRVDTAETGLSDHLADAIDAHDASAISYVNTTSGLTATDTQAAIDEVDGDLDTHIADTTAHGATGAVMGTTNTQTVQNKTLDATNDAELRDNNLTITGNVDFSKKFNFNADTVTTGTTRTIGIPDANTTLVGDDSTQTITNKTIDADNNTITNLAHGAEVDNPSSGVHGVTGNIVGTSDTQDLTNKTFTDAITLEELSTTPSNPAAGDKKFYAKNDSKLYTLDSAGNEIEVGSGSGQGGINYIDNPNFETDINNWTGDTNLVISHETTSPLRGSGSLKITKGAVNASTQEIYADTFNVDSADLAKKMLGSFDYDFSDANYSDDDARVEVEYDLGGTPKTIRVNGEGLKAGKGTHYFTFQTDATITDYRVKIVWQATTTVVVSAYIDNVIVGPQKIAYGTYQRQELIDLTGQGDFTGGSLLVSRVGSNVTVQTQSTITFVSNSNPDAAGVIPSWARPSDRKNNIFTNSTSIIYTVTVDETGAFDLIFRNYSGSLTALTSSSSDLTISYSIEDEFQPITSEDFGGKDIVVRYSGLADTSIGNGSEEALIFNTEVKDTTSNAYNSSTGDFTAPESGWYDISATVAWANASFDPGESYYIAMNVNGTQVKRENYEQSATNASDNKSITLSDTYYLNKDDVLDLAIFQNSGGNNNLSGLTSRATLSIAKRSSPQTILETETVAARIEDTSGLSIVPSTATTLFSSASPEFDTHGSFSSGVFNVPVSGFYNIASSVKMASATFNAGKTVDLQVDVNGTSYQLNAHEIEATGALRIYLAGSILLDLNKGDQVKITISHNEATNRSVDPSARQTHFSIARIK